MIIELHQVDLTKVSADAIVNAANSSLMGGGGVDGAIHRAGGKEILEECIQIKGGCPTGEAVITTAGKLPAKFVIHTVGPVWKGGNFGESEKLKSCYKNSLQLASENQCKTIAFPNISTGVYHYPLNEAADIAIQTVRESSFPGIEKVIFVCFSEDNYRLYEEKLAE